MRKNVPAAAAALFYLLLAVSCNTKTPFSAREFSSPEMKWRPVPLWYCYNAVMTDSVAAEEIVNMFEKDGYGGFAMIPYGRNYGPSYLSEEYFDLYGNALKTVADHGGQVSLYDEYGFPSGSMGASSGMTLFRDRHPGKTLKRLDKQEFGAGNGKALELKLSDIPGKLMSLVAVDTVNKKTVSLSEFVEDGRLVWTAPESGCWTVMAFNCVTDGDPIVDYLDPEAVKLFIEDTHEQYFKRFPEAFGTTITSTFFDEPTMYRCNGRVWTDKFNEEFELRNGFKADTLYPCLWYDMGEVTAVQRNLMFGLRAQLYAEGFMRTIAQWAEAHGIASTGHQDQEEVCNTTSVSGDLMLDGKYMTMPGIDKIGGDRPAENFYKVVSSSAQNWDHAEVMSETYGAMGNLPVEQMYSIAIEQFTKGITNLIPHAVWYDDKQVKFLPELSWRNPLYNKDLKTFNTFLARLRYMLAREGRHKADIAVLYPIHTQQAGHHLDGPLHCYAGGVAVPGTDYNRISALLTDELGHDFTYLHPEVLDERCLVGADGTLTMENAVNTECFNTILLPGVKVISISNLRKIDEARKAGATIIFTTQVPEQSADSNANDDEIRAIVADMLSAGNVHYVPEPSAESLRLALSEKLPDVSFETGDHPFNYIHKEIDGCNVFYFGNIDSTASRCTVHLRERLGKPCLMDPHSGECRKLPAGNEFEIGLDPAQSVFLIDGEL